MKKLNVLLMMFASLSLFAISSCDNKKDKIEEPEITLRVSGGASVELLGVDIAKDITVTASEKATRDIVVNITSNAAEGEAVIAPAQVTIKKGELTATSKITFSALKFPKGTAEKKITVTINTTTEHVKPDVGTTDFLVKGEGGKELIPLTIAGSATELNTTAAEQTLTVTATLTTAATEEVSIAIAYDGSTANLIELFKEIKTIVIAKDATTGTATFKVGKGVEGELKLAFSTTNDKVDLQTKSLAATFAVDKNNLTITGSGTTFETYEGPKTLTVSYTLAEELAEDLDIALTYEGSATAIKTLFASRTSIRIAAGVTSGSEEFTVPKGTVGKLVIGFATTNTDVAIKPAPSLTATFTSTIPPTESLCGIAALSNRWGYLAGFNIGDKEVIITKADGAYQNKLGETIVNIADGDQIKAYSGSNEDGDQAVYGHVWVDWNKDNSLSDSEIVGTTTTLKLAPMGSINKEFLVFNFAAPADTPSGTYHMRIGTNYKTGLSGCDNAEDESRTAYDLTINYTSGTEEPPTEDPTFALVKANNDPIVVPATGDFEATFNVTLSKVSEEVQTVNLVVATSTSGKSGTLSTASVTFAANETTKPVTITFASNDFTADNITADVTVTGMSSLEATAASIVYSVKGAAVVTPPTKQELDCYLESPTLNNKPDCIFMPAETSRTLEFYVAADKAGQVGDVSFDVAVTGAASSDYQLEGVTDGKVTITEPATGAKGQASFKVIVSESAIGKELAVTISSEDATIQARYTSRPIVPKRLTPPATPLKYNVDYVAADNDSKSLTVSQYAYTYVTITTENEETPSQPLLLTPIFEGDFTVSNLPKEVVLTSGSTEIMFLIPFNSTTNGQKGTLKFTSDYTTISSEPITFTIQK